MRLFGFLNYGTLLLLVFVAMLFGCAKDDEPDVVGELKNPIEGEWTWVQSIGGFAGQTLTPENTMSTRLLNISVDTYQEYINDSLVYESQYMLGMDSISTRLEFESGGILWYQINENELQIQELCPDCYDHWYEKN